MTKKAFNPGDWKKPRKKADRWFDCFTKSEYLCGV